MDAQLAKRRIRRRIGSSRPVSPNNSPFGEGRFAALRRTLHFTMNAAAPETWRDAATYTFRIAGHIGRRLRRALEPLEVHDENPGTTSFRVCIPDQAALYGVLRRLEATGCTLLSLRQDER